MRGRAAALSRAAAAAPCCPAQTSWPPAAPAAASAPQVLQPVLVEKEKAEQRLKVSLFLLFYFPTF